MLLDIPKISGGIGLDHLEPLAVRRDHERLPQGDDVRIDLDHLDFGARQVTMAEFRQRSAAQADHQNAGGFGIEQHETHHHPRVLEVERIGAQQGHTALDLLLGEMQGPLRAGIQEEGPGAAGRRRWSGGDTDVGHGV